MMGSVFTRVEHYRGRAPIFRAPCEFPPGCHIILISRSMIAVFERCSFVSLTTSDLGRARRFWVEALGFPIIEEREGDYFIVDAGGLRLCVDAADGDLHRSGGSDPVIGVKDASVRDAPEKLAAPGDAAGRRPLPRRQGQDA